MRAAAATCWVLALLLAISAIGAYVVGSISAYRERDRGATYEVVEKVRQEGEATSSNLLLVAVALFMCSLFLGGSRHHHRR